MKIGHEKHLERVVTKASNFNRVLIIGIAILVGWEASELRKTRLEVQMSLAQANQNKMAVENNTQQLLGFIKEWSDSKQAIAEWMKARNEQTAEIATKPKRTPRPIPIPVELLPDVEPSTPPPATATPVKAQTPKTITKKVYVRPTPGPWERFWKGSPPKRKR